MMCYSESATAIWQHQPKNDDQIQHVYSNLLFDVISGFGWSSFDPQQQQQTVIDQIRPVSYWLFDVISGFDSDLLHNNR
ncbi:hypothetical protein GJ496_005662 [Pomphorhynchus laevis]|nr:hypothetical protein GJ496_005662 [Pomphorhynchus laevis]